MLNESGSAGAVETADSGVPPSALPYTRMAAAMAVAGMTTLVDHVLEKRFPHVPPQERQAYVAGLLGLSGGDGAIAQIFLNTHGRLAAVALGAASPTLEKGLHAFAPQLEATMTGTLNDAIEVAAHIRNAIRVVMGTQCDPHVIRNVDFPGEGEVVIEGISDDVDLRVLQQLSPTFVQPVLTGRATKPTSMAIYRAVRSLKGRSA